MRPSRPTDVEWVVLAAVLCLATWLAAGHALLARVDLTLYDAGLALWRRPPPPQVVVVAIDDQSLAALGRWPWRRAVHATLVERISAARPKAIALDVILSEPDTGDPRGDEALARAIAAAGNVVVVSPIVAVAGEGAREIAPLEPFAKAAAAVAHIQVETDEDGVVRGLPLFDGLRSVRPYLGLAALEVAGLVPRETTPAPARGGRFLIPYYGPDGTVTRHSYASVLLGEVPASAFAGRVVLVGAAAAGLGDAHPAPAGGRAAPMAGVEIAAQVAGAVLEGTRIRAAPPATSAIVSAACLLLVLGLYRVLQPRAALALTAGALVAVLAGSFLALRLLQVWIPPSATLFGIAACYPLWSWRRLEAALRYMRGELARLQREPGVTPTERGARARREMPADPIDATILPLEDAIASLRDARRFIADTIESLPQALIATDASGRVVLANSRACEWAGLDRGRFAGLARAPAAGGPDSPTLADVLARFSPAGSRTWESVMDETFATRQVVQLDARGPGDREVIAFLSPCFRAGGELVGLIANMVDVTEKRDAERRREDLLRILSHDMRAPQASIITLLEMRAMDPGAVETETLLARVRSFARRTLELADDFLRLARAEKARTEQFVELDFADVAEEACGEAWTLARAKNIRIERRFEVDAAPVMGDRSLLLRMIENLLTNAIKFSPEATTVRVSLEPQGVSWLLRVADEGRGISREDMPRLFTRFGRVGARADDPGGVGLGLVMVRTVVERHRGVVSVASEPGRGSTFSVSLPAARHEGQA